MWLKKKKEKKKKSLTKVNRQNDEKQQQATHSNTATLTHFVHTNKKCDLESSLLTITTFKYK